MYLHDSYSKSDQSETPRRRLTGVAVALLSVALSPPMIAIGSFVCDHNHPYVGGVVVAYGLLWGIGALLWGVIESVEHGLFED